jgi:hypothetical protein
MRALRTGLLIGICLAQFLTCANVGWTQVSRPLQNRIPKADPKKYHAIQDGKDWKNPKLIVRPEGIEIVGVTSVGQAIAVEAVPGVLERLPDSAWPYGLVVATSDIGIVSSRRDQPRIEANRTRLLKVLRALGIAVDLWPSA